LNDWLEEQDVDPPVDIAENFVDFSFTPADLDGFANVITVKDLSPVL
jgi:hypothetical protein